MPIFSLFLEASRLESLLALHRRLCTLPPCALCVERKAAVDRINAAILDARGVALDQR